MATESRMTAVARFLRMCVIVSLFATATTIGLYWYLDTLAAPALAIGLKWAGFALGSLGTLGLMSNNMENSVVAGHHITHITYRYPDTNRDWKTMQLEMLEAYRFALLMLIGGIMTASYGLLLNWWIETMLP